MSVKWRHCSATGPAGKSSCCEGVKSCPRAGCGRSTTPRTWPAPSGRCRGVYPAGDLRGDGADRGAFRERAKTDRRIPVILTPISRRSLPGDGEGFELYSCLLVAVGAGIWPFIDFSPAYNLRESSRFHFHSDANLSAIIFDEMNARLLKSFLYFDDRRELPFLNAFVSFNALQGRQA
jgi:hypothetical protein